MPNPKPPLPAPAPSSTTSAPPRARLAAIVGRPNVGKSALFNRLAGRTISIVHDQAGVTRDRILAECTLGSAPFDIMDTGGIGDEVDPEFSTIVHHQAEIAIQTASIVLLVVDGQAGVNAIDTHLAQKLRRARVPVIVVVNKVDHTNHEAFEADFHSLGLPHLMSVSAAHGRGISHLVEALEKHLPPPDPADPDHDDDHNDEDEDDNSAAGQTDPDTGAPVKKPRRHTGPFRLAIVGRPNAGKSSLINAILHDERAIVSEIPGTTRDAVDIAYTHNKEEFLLIDTAGLRQRNRRDSSVEIFSAMRTERSIRRADLCILVLDVTQGLTSQDKKIADLILEAEKPCILALNKTDLIIPVPGETHAEAIAKTTAAIRTQLFFLPYAPDVPLSALTGANVPRLFTAIQHVRRDAKVKIPTGPLNRIFKDALQSNPPPPVTNKRLTILYATQISESQARLPIPEFLLFVNHASLLEENYRRFLEGRVRAYTPFWGLPIILRLRGRAPAESRTWEKNRTRSPGSDPSAPGASEQPAAEQPKPARRRRDPSTIPRRSGNRPARPKPGSKSRKKG